MKKKKTGFTLIELLVVVAILSIVATIVVIALDPKHVTNKSKAARIASELQSIEEAFQLSIFDNGMQGVFFTEDELNLGENPNVSLMTLLDIGVLGYLPRETPIAPYGLGTSYYRYDNDGDLYHYLDNCPGSSDYGGANIFITRTQYYPDLVQEIDKIIDHGDGLKCGKIRTINSVLFYNMSPKSDN